MAHGDAGRTDDGMLYRSLGRTGETISVVGVGGSHIGKQEDPRESIRIIRTAIDHGVTLMDNSWDYNEGGSVERMGQALRDGYRERVFLMTKFDGRTRSAAARQIDQSLARLQVDHVDLLMFHEVIRMEDVDRFFAGGGAMEAALAARDAGKTRYLGFTGHKDPAIHLYMLDRAREHGFPIDASLMPLNVMDPHFKSFERLVLPRLISAEIGILSMKPMGGSHILRTGLVTPEECLHYVMSVSPGSVVVGIDRLEVLEQTLAAVRTFRHLTQPKITELLSRTIGQAETGQHEPFKTSTQFDSTVEHPEYMG